MAREIIPETNILPPEGSPDVGAKVFWLLEQILTDKENLGLTDKWTQNHRMMKGEHWRSKTTIQGVKLVKANLVRVHLERTINQLTDNNPVFEVTSYPDTEGQEPQGINVIQKAAEEWWVEHEQQAVLEESVSNGEEYGIACEKVVFNPDLGDNGEGDVETIPLSPYEYGWYPVDLRDPRLIQKAEAFLHFYPMTVREAQRLWPDKAAIIRPDEDSIKELNDERREVQQGIGASKKGSPLFTSIAGVVNSLLNFGGDTTTDGEPRTLIVEAWVRDYTGVRQTVAVESRGIDEETGEEVGTSVTGIDIVPKYPGYIRQVTVCNHGKVVLDDRANPNVNPAIPDDLARRTYLYWRFPFAAANSIRDTANAWGISAVEDVEGLNIEFNKSISQLVFYKDKAARLKLINPVSTGVQNHEFTNYPSVVNPTTPMAGDAIRYLQIPEPPVDIANSISLFQDLFFMVGGSFDVQQLANIKGSNPLAYKTISALLEQAATRMRGKIRSYSRLVRERGRMYVSMVQNFYTEERFITVQNGTGGKQPVMFRGTDMLYPVKLTVVSGSTMPVSRVQQREEAATLFKMGAIDNEELLARLDWPNRAEILTRMRMGPVGMFIERLMQAGLPQPLAQYMQALGQMDDKAFEREAKNGNVMPFMDVVIAMLQQGQGQQPKAPDPEQEKAFAEARKAIAEAEKTEAEKALTIEKITTERVEQQVRLMGIKYDEEMLKIERAKVVADVEKANKAMEMGEKQPPNYKQRQGYQERGLKSNNKEQV